MTALVYGQLGGLSDLHCHIQGHQHEEHQPFFGLALYWWYAVFTMSLRTGCFARVREQALELLVFCFIS